MMFSSTVMAVLMGASMANAHMIMSSPVPYGKDTLNNSPLAADGSDFPCKLRDGVYDAPTAETILGIGEDTPLTFIGSATHGGGSCQISLTTDLEPTKSSKWQVIKSFEGGCPANVDGNLSGGEEPDTFKFAIPEGIAPGKYTLAWTWFNRIGNREMYMNCAPITVTGGSSKRSTQELEKRAPDFPPMFVANVNGCMTTEMIDIRFPNPGEYVEYLGNPANLAKEGAPACTGTPTFGGDGNTPASGSGSGSSGTASSGSGSGSSGTASTGSDSGAASSGSASSGSSSPSAESAPTEAPAPTVPVSVPTAQPVATTAPAPTPDSTDSAGSDSGSGSSAGVLTGPCSTNGQWNCVGGNTFQRCASGTWSAAQQMATGTECNTGLSAELLISASKKARHVSNMRFRRRSIHGAVHGSHFA
ncbi:uncharacterized protein N7515_000944 [Penicillium bovifimosum]|uniref:Lytic polysaccharide monooxygenase n=1 Tax=Penicillium bovifimosum TaxID=126998 RepID=A0A9W9LBV9_9EURO|nr:uncharacterized protein N7515_000944 [Penicillium bovifimosum]KAJ5146380.1 hypothetical protein N7515_000944 [Penicillium bovifimosum]